MTTRYCVRCKLQIEFVGNDIKCPVCSRETMLDFEQVKIERVRDLFVKALQKKNKGG